MRINWNKKELIIVLNLYYKIPFSKIHYKHPEITNLSKILNRTSSAIALKLVNFARLDPDLQKRKVSGMKHGAKLDEEIWNKYYNKWDLLAFESESILATYKNKPVELSSEIDLSDIPAEGKEREAVVKARVNQKFFRSMVLACYENKCCITGIDVPQLLIASHIKPWSIDVNNRMNPRNGLCLNLLHDKAFDKGLMTITLNYKIKLSTRLRKNNNTVITEFFKSNEDKQIELPSRFLPSKEFLEFHNDEIFQS